jgi:hypothetical protein
MAKGSSRDEFKMPVLRLIAEQVGYLCSNPGCGAPTRGPSKSKGASNVGVGAHITAAASRGPRYDPTLTKLERESPNNAIWLCARCGRLVDNDTSTYTRDDLLDWKTQAISRAHRALETGKTPRPSPSKRARTHDEARFHESDTVMSEWQLQAFMDDLDDDAFHLDVQEPLDRWVNFFSLEGNQFLIPSIRERCTTCVRALVNLRTYIAFNFFIHPNTLGSKRLALHPDLNVDRGGSGRRETRRYLEAAKELHQLADDVLEACRLYRRTVKEQLAI